MMKLKSTMNSRIFNIEYVTFGSIFTAFVFGIIMSFAIISIGGWNMFIKAAVLLFSFFIIINVVGELKDEKEKDVEFKKAILVILLAFFVCEINLYANSSYDKTVDVLVTTVPYNNDKTTIEYYGVTVNERVDWVRVDNKRTKLLDYHTSVTKIRTYIDYTPFIHYSEEKEYIRKNQ